VSRPRRGKPDTNDTRDQAVAQLAAEQWGIVDNADLRACGLSRDAVMRRRRAGHLFVVYPGVYAVGHAGLTPRGRFLAAVKACGPGAVLSHYSAGSLWELVIWDEDRPIDVIVPGRGTRTIPGINVHRTRNPPKILHFDGIPVTTPARALADLSLMLPFITYRRAVREGMARKRVTLTELREQHNATLDRIIADGHVPSRTELEDAVHDLIITHGFEPPQVNHPLHLDGRTITPDFRWPAHHLVIEADSKEWHDNPITRQDDAAKQATLEAHGERVLRVTWHQTIARPKQTAARIQRAGAPRSV
jgi:very-short-patch-repair endonuclease